MLEEVAQDFKSLNSSLKKGLGKNGYALLIAGGLVVALVLITKSKQQSQEDDYTVATGVASYPDVGENADVIISSIGSSIDYAQDEIIDSIGETVKNTGEDIKDTMHNEHEDILSRLDKDSIGGGNSNSGNTTYVYGESETVPKSNFEMALEKRGIESISKEFKETHGNIFNGISDTNSVQLPTAVTSNLTDVNFTSVSRGQSNSLATGTIQAMERKSAIGTLKPMSGVKDTAKTKSSSGKKSTGKKSTGKNSEKSKPMSSYNGSSKPMSNTNKSSSNTRSNSSSILNAFVSSKNSPSKHTSNKSSPSKKTTGKKKK